MYVMRVSHFFGITISRLLGSQDTLHYFRHVCRFRDTLKYILPTLIFPNDVPSHQQIPHFHYFGRIFAILSIFLDCWTSLWHITTFMICPAFMLTFSLIIHLQMTIPYTTKHSFSLFCVLSSAIPLSTLTRLSGSVACINVSILNIFWNPPLNHSYTKFLLKTLSKLHFYIFWTNVWNYFKSFVD